MTIVEAAATVLRQAGRALTAGEIYEGIKSDNLYSFKAKSPEQILSQQLRRHCVDVNNATASKEKWFSSASGGRFELLEGRK